MNNSPEKGEILLYADLCTVVTCWVPQEEDSEVKFSMRIFIKQCPWDQYLQQRWGGSRNGQGKKLCCEEGLPATLADFMGKLWSHNDPLELSGAFMLWHQSVVYVGHEKGYGGLRQECTFPGWCNKSFSKMGHGTTSQSPGRFLWAVVFI